MICGALGTDRMCEPGGTAGSAAARQRGVAARAAAWLCAGEAAVTPVGERWAVYELTLALERALTAWCADVNTNQIVHSRTLVTASSDGATHTYDAAVTSRRIALSLQVRRRAHAAALVEALPHAPEHGDGARHRILGERHSSM